MDVYATVAALEGTTAKAVHPGTAGRLFGGHLRRRLLVMNLARLQCKNRPCCCFAPSRPEKLLPAVVAIPVGGRAWSGRHGRHALAHLSQRLARGAGHTVEPVVEDDHLIHIDAGICGVFHDRRTVEAPVQLHAPCANGTNRCRCRERRSGSGSCYRD